MATNEIFLSHITCLLVLYWQGTATSVVHKLCRYACICSRCLVLRRRLSANTHAHSYLQSEHIIHYYVSAAAATTTNTSPTPLYSFKITPPLPSPPQLYGNTTATTTPFPPSPNHEFNFIPSIDRRERGTHTHTLTANTPRFTLQHILVT